MRSKTNTGSIELACAWAKAKGADGMSNYEAFVSGLNRIRCALGSALCTTGRNVRGNMVSAAMRRLEQERNMPRESYPVLLRMAIMDYPQLVQVARPLHQTDLDSQASNAKLRRSFRDVTGRKPCVSRWELALDA